MSAGPLNGRVALVTGAGRGIGAAAAERLARDGAQVVAVARNEAELRELQQRTGAHWIAADLAEPDACERVLTETLQRFGALDVLVNNAGLGSAGEGRVWELDPDRWRAAFALNLDAPFQLTRLALPRMIERSSGRVVMVASLAALRGGVAPGMSAYASSKHGLLGLMRAVAVEVAPLGVTCNAVLPGSVRTRTAESKVAEEAAAAGTSVERAWQARAQRTTGGRLVEAQECAAAIAFLASPEASAINGQALGVAL